MTSPLLVIDRYLFRPGSLSDLAIVRIVVVAGQLIFFYPDLAANLERAAAPTGEFLALPALKVLLLPIGEWGLRPDPTLIHAVWVFGLMVGVLALIGKHTNAALLALAASVTFLIAHRYSYGYIHHPDGLMALYLWVLAFSPCGRRWSLDELEWRLRHSEANGEFEPRLAEDEASMFARWPLVLGQWLLAIAYFSAGTSKIIHGGVDWFRSSTLAHYLVQDGVRWDSPIGLFMAGMPEALVALAVFTVLFEATFFIAILEPRSTWLYLLGGAALHVGILITMRAPFIQWVTLYVVFIENLRRHWPLTVISRRLASNRRWTLIHDGGCSPSVRSAVLLHFADARDSLRILDVQRDGKEISRIAPHLLPERALHATHVVTPDGKLLEGFDALAEMTRTLPLLWPAYPVTHAPVLRQVARWIHGGTAGRRRRTVCATGACGMRQQSRLQGSGEVRPALH